MYRFGLLPRAIQIIVGLAMVFGITILDFLSGTELSFSIFYFIPLVLVSWYGGHRIGTVFACVCAFAWAYAEYSGGNVYSASYIFIFNTLVRLMIFLTISSLIWRLKVGSNLLKEKELLAQKSYDVINTSQKIITVLAKNIIARNSELWLWIVKEKQAKKDVPKIIEQTCEQIGANLSALTEICYSYQPVEKENINTEDLISQLEERLQTVNEKYHLQGLETENVAQPSTTSLLQYNDNE